MRDESDVGAGVVLGIVAEQLAEFGGVERIIHTLMRRYPRSFVVAGRFDTRPGFPAADFEARARQRGIPVDCGADGADRIRLVGRGGLRSHFLSPLYARWIRTAPLEEASTVLSLGGMAWTLAVRVPAGSRHVGYIGGPPRPFYSHIEHYLRPYPRALRPVLRAAIPGLRAHHRRLLARPDRILTNSLGCARGLERLLGRPVGVLYPPARTDFFTPEPRDGSHFLAVARLFAHKRVDVLVEAFRKLPGERLIVAGEGPALERLRSAAPANVTFAGHVADHELRELYRASRALVTASIEEFGIANVEALACGVPVIGPRAGGTGEIVDDGETGVLFEDVDAHCVRDAVRRFERLDLDPAACRRGAERFSEERFLEQLEPVLSA